MSPCAKLYNTDFALFLIGMDVPQIVFRELERQCEEGVQRVEDLSVQGLLYRRVNEQNYVARGQGTYPSKLLDFRKTLLDNGGMVVFEIAIELCEPGTRRLVAYTSS